MPNKETLIDTLSTETTTLIDSLNSGSVTILDVVKRTSDIDLSEIITTIGTEVMYFILKVALSLVIYYIGRWLIHRVMMIMEHALKQREVEHSLRLFLCSIVRIVSYVLLILIIVQLLGINTTSLVAMLASAGLAIGMALSGTLQNFAGGVMVLFLKPYKIGDYINAQGQSGYVREIMLFTTVLETYDGNRIFLPNSTISSSIIDNYSYAGVRRVVWQVSVSYGDDYDVIHKALMEMLLSDGRIIQDAENKSKYPSVVLESLADSAVVVTARAWVAIDDYWPVLFDINKRIYTELPKCGARFPFPQMDVHIKNS